MLDDLLVDLEYDSAITILVSESLGVRIAGGPAHVFSCSIAPRVEWVSSSNRLPFNPRSRAVQTSAQESPSAT